MFNMNGCVTKYFLKNCVKSVKNAKSIKYVRIYVKVSFFN